MTRMRALKLGACLAGAVLLSVGWVSLGPQPLGGRAEYIITSGTSMTPLLHTGDLVVVRRSSSYEVGDVVAYHSASLHVVVLHRIVGIAGDRYRFKGDHNTWVDTDRPTRADLIGKMAYRLPGMGSHLRSLHSPPGVTALAGLGAVVVVGGGKRRKGARGRHRSSVAGGSSHGAPAAFRGGAPTRLIALSAVAGMFVLLTGLTFVRPSARPGSSGIPYSLKGAFAYSAEGVDAGVYEGGRITTGDPVYLRVTRRVRASFSYRIESTAPVIASGTVALAANVSDLDGWARTVQIAAAHPFTGARAEVAGTLDIARLQGIIAELQRRTGVSRDSYVVTLLPEIHLDAAIGGHPLVDTFAPSLTFRLDALELVIQPSGTGVGASDPLAPSRGGLLPVVSTSAAGPFTLLGVRLPVGPVRAVAALGALGALMLLASSLWSADADGDAGEAGRIEARYGKWLVPVSAPETGGRAGAVDVATMDDLVRLAEHYDRMILHEARLGADDYLVEEDATTYRYHVPAGLTNGHTNGHANGRTRAHAGRRH